MSAPVQFSLRSNPRSSGAAAVATAPDPIFTAVPIGDDAPKPKVKVAPIPIPPPSRADVADDTPLLLRNVNPDVLAAADKDKCRVDMASRPDAPDRDAYERVPVHEFGYAMMAGMGWTKGQPIGRTNPQVVEPFEYLRRPHLLGLGAQPSPADLDLPSMTGKKRKKQPNVAELIDPKTGKTRYRKGIDEVLEERDRPIAAGDRVRIDAHPYEGQAGVVNSIAGHIAQVVLDGITNPVRVELRHLSRSSERSSKAVPVVKSSRSGRSSSDLTWVVPDLVVRLIKDGHRLRTSKGRVYDIVSRSQFTMLIDGVLVDDLAEADVETYVPDQPGIRLRVVAGKYAGQYGRLYRRLRDKGKAEVDLDKGKRVSVRLDDVSQVAE